MTGARLEAAAAALLGVPFRLGGRDPASGLDCVGLITAALEASGRQIGPLPRYSLRQFDLSRFLAIADKIGLRATNDTGQIGDILLLRPSPMQHHLAILRGDGGIVHAHAELGRVVITPHPLPWPITRCWRLA